jgi:GT2 family glycosyltransferase
MQIVDVGDFRKKAFILIPTYTQGQDLDNLVYRIYLPRPDVCIIVVDGNSPDGKGDIAECLALR